RNGDSCYTTSAVPPGSTPSPAAGGGLRGASNAVATQALATQAVATRAVARRRFPAPDPARARPLLARTPLSHPTPRTRRPSEAPGADARRALPIRRPA